MEVNIRYSVNISGDEIIIPKIIKSTGVDIFFRMVLFELGLAQF